MGGQWQDRDIMMGESQPSPFWQSIELTLVPCLKWD